MFYSILFLFRAGTHVELLFVKYMVLCLDVFFKNVNGGRNIRAPCVLTDDWVHPRVMCLFVGCCFGFGRAAGSFMSVLRCRLLCVRRSSSGLH